MILVHPLSIMEGQARVIWKASKNSDHLDKAWKEIRKIRTTILVLLVILYNHITKL